MINDPFLVIIIYFILSASHTVFSSAPPSVRTCEPIRLDMCKKIGYNATGMPNTAGHETQDEAEQSFLTFEALINFRCSSQLPFFLCSVYFPMCTEKIFQTIGPCRPLCETVKDRCLPILEDFGFTWPSHLNCSSFPPTNDNQNMCMPGPGEDESEAHMSPRKIRPILDYKPTAIRDKSPDHSLGTIVTEIVTPSVIRSPTSLNHSKLFGPISDDCRDLKFHQQYFNVHTGINQSQCIHDCRADILYPSSTKQFADFWIAFWSTFCLASSVYTVFIFFCHPTRFQYPERTVVFMGMSYFVYSVTHLLSIAIGRVTIGCYEDHQYRVSLLIQDGHANGYCVSVFILLYYSNLASLLWWLLLTLTLYFVIGLQWSTERLERWSPFFHSCAWGLPLFVTITILLKGDIGADELTGNCNVGNHNPDALLTFIIVPSVCVLATGLVIFLMSVKEYFDRRSLKVYQPATNGLLVTQSHGSYQSSSEKISFNNLSSQNSHPPLIPMKANWPSRPKLTEELGYSLVRLGIFQIIYFAISSYLLFVSFYEFFNRDSWYSGLVPDLPNVEIMSLKIFMSFLAGIMTGIWVWMSEPQMPFIISPNWQKTSPISQIIPHSHHTLPVTSSLATLDDRARYYHRGSETTV